MLFSVDQTVTKKQILNTKQFIADLVQITLHFYISKKQKCAIFKVPTLALIMVQLLAPKELLAIQDQQKHHCM